jgi:hypothetical protein
MLLSLLLACDPDDASVWSDRGLLALDEDSDGDGYADRDELAEGHDPFDPDDRIYQGSWPYNRHKDRLGDPGFGPIGVGDQLGRFVGDDQFGEPVELYDFARDRPIVLMLAVQWCPPDQAVAAWLAGGTDSYGLESRYAPVRAAVDSGDLVWITEMMQTNAGNPATAETSAEWEAAYPNARIPVLADPDGLLFTSLRARGYPSFYAIAPDMTVAYGNADQNTLDFTALDVALAMVDDP